MWQMPEVIYHPHVSSRETNFYGLAMPFCGKYTMVAVDYFTKWVEAKPLATISNKKVQNFV